VVFNKVIKASHNIVKGNSTTCTAFIGATSRHIVTINTTVSTIIANKHHITLAKGLLPVY
jgi:hypothetical protein